MVVGNNLGCKYRFASKGMLFSELAEQVKKMTSLVLSYKHTICSLTEKLLHPL